MSVSVSTAIQGQIAGATYLSEEGETAFLVWAPVASQVEVVFSSGQNSRSLSQLPGGYWGGQIDCPPGTLYKFRLNQSEDYPDPASRFQPAGPHEWSEVIDASAFQWSDDAWPGLEIGNGQIIYEMHVGTFTEQGTWAAAAEKLPYLNHLGITLVEIMPVADFPGRFNWGYDGVLFFSPVAVYGRPDDFRAFVDRAHQLGLGVLLDVVYNHLGPDGNYLSQFSPDYFSDKHTTDWGPAINYDGKNSDPVRRFFCDNAAYWIRDFHLDGLRFDATQDIHDDSTPHILQQLGEAARASAGKRSLVLIGENEPQDTRLLRPIPAGGFGFDALWNDDYHHSASVALTGKSDAYYRDYRGSAQELLSAAKYGYLFQGQWYVWQKQRRGTTTFGLPRAAMVSFIQNHDQIANSAHGDRVHNQTSPGNLKAMTALTILMPGSPMLFQGQEFAASAPFLFFADHKPELAEKVLNGRREFLEQWQSLKLPEMQRCFDDPANPKTFARCKLNHGEVELHQHIYRLHRDLIQLRRHDPIISHGGSTGLDGAVLSPQSFLLRFFSDDHLADRLLLVNLGVDLRWSPAPEPLLAPPAGSRWQKLWSSEDPQYGGCGTAVLDTEESWHIPGQAAVVLFSVPVSQ